MKYITFLVIAFLASLCLQAQTVLIKDSSYNVDYYYGDPGPGSASTTVNTYTYGSDCKLQLVYNDGDYVDTRYTYVYNATGKLYQIVADILSPGGNVIGGSRKTYKYIDNGGVASVRSEAWQGGAYVKDSLTYYQYNAQNLPTRKFIKLWNPATATFDNNRLDSTVYTFRGQLSELYTYLWGSGAKKLAYKSRKDYNPDGTLDTTADYDFVDFEQRAVGAVKYNYTYFDTLKIKYQQVASYYESYVPGAWALANTRTLQHDSANHISYDTSTNTNYGNITQYVTRTYNTDGTLQSVYTLDDYPDNSYTDQTIYTAYTYASCLPAATAQTAGALPRKLTVNTIAVLVSPNPVLSVMHVSLPAPSKTNNSICVYDAGGRLVMQQTVAAGASSLNIDCSRLGRGMYMVRYENEIQKMMKE